MDALPVRSRVSRIVRRLRPPQVRCQTGADPDQWDWNFREALGKRREGLGQSPGSNTESPRPYSDAMKIRTVWKLPWSLPDRQERPYRVSRIYTDERRDVPGPTVALPETPHLWSSVVIRRLIRDSGTGGYQRGIIVQDSIQLMKLGSGLKYVFAYISNYLRLTEPQFFSCTWRRSREPKSIKKINFIPQNKVETDCGSIIYPIPILQLIWVLFLVCLFLRYFFFSVQATHEFGWSVPKITLDPASWTLPLPLLYQWFARRNVHFSQGCLQTIPVSEVDAKVNDFYVMSLNKSSRCSEFSVIKK